MDLSIRRLRSFVVIAEELSFTAAARRLSLAQQAVSVHITRLEKEFGVTLFERTTRRVSLTSEGSALIDHARQLVDEADRFAARLALLHRTGVGEASIAYTHSTGYELLPQLVRAIAAKLPSIELTTRELYDVDVVAGVAAGRFDLGIARKPTMLPGTVCEILRDEQVLLVVATSHPLAGAGRASLCNLADERLILWPRDLIPGYFDTVKSAWLGAGLNPDIDTSSTGWSMWSRVANGEGVTLVATSARGREPAGVQFIELDDDIHLEASVVWRSDGTSVLGAALIQIARRMRDGAGECMG